MGDHVGIPGVVLLHFCTFAFLLLFVPLEGSLLQAIKVYLDPDDEHVHACKSKVRVFEDGTAQPKIGSNGAWTSMTSATSSTNEKLVTMIKASDIESAHPCCLVVRRRKQDCAAHCNS